MRQEAILFLLEPQKWKRFRRTGLKHSRTGTVVFGGFPRQRCGDQKGPALVQAQAATASSKLN